MVGRRGDCPFTGITKTQRENQMSLTNPGQLKECEICGVHYHEGEIPKCNRESINQAEQ